MYRAIVGSVLKRAFGHINAGQYRPILASFGPKFEHFFPGDHALGGYRNTEVSNKAWYDRLGRIFPDLRFDIETLLVKGWPWNTLATIEWRDHFGLPDGTRGGNRGVHTFRLRWGKVVSLHIYTDTQRLSGYLKRIAALGVAEAAAEPIEDPRPT